MSNIQKNNKPNVPNLRFPEFSGEWKKSILKAECEINPKTGPLADTFQYIDLESVVKGQLIKVNYLKKEDAPSRAQRVLSKWDILYQCVRPYQLNNFLVRDNSSTQRVASTGYAQIRTNNNPDFFFQLLHTQKFTGRVINRCTGTNYPAINSTDLSEIEINIPEIKEQEKIGRMLSLIDQRIAIQNRLIEKKLKTALEDTCFYNCGGKQVCLRDILVERGERSNRNNQYEVLSSTVEGIYSQREYFKKEIASADNAGYKVIHLGDIVLSPQNLWMGNINYNDRFSIGIVSPSYKVFSIKPTFDEQFVASILKTKRALWKYSLVSEQGASIVRRNLNMEDFYEISFAIPSLEKQRRIGEGISSIRDKIRLEQSYLNILNSHKSYLLSKMFI